jgi:alcohol dehydrogenase
MPPISLIGCGASKAVGDYLKTLGGKKALIVTDKGLAKIGVADTIKKYIEEAGLQAFI